MQDLEDHKIFRENGGGNLSSPIEYKEGTLENWMPIRGIIRIIQSLGRGGGVVAGFWGSEDFQGEWRGDLLSPI